MILWESFYEFSYDEYFGSLLTGLCFVVLFWHLYDQKNNKPKRKWIVSGIYVLAVLCWFSYWHHYSNTPYMVKDHENAVLFKDVVVIRISTKPYSRYALLSLSNGTEAKFKLSRAYVFARDGSNLRSLRFKDILKYK